VHLAAQPRATRAAAQRAGAPSGVSFPELDGRRSTTATASGIVADAARSVDPALTRSVLDCESWRDHYISFLVELTALSAEPSRSLAIAQAGLESMRRRLVLEDGVRTVELDRALDEPPSADELGSAEIHGTGRPVAQLEVPYRGRTLHGSALLEQVETWVRAGVVEPSFGHAVARVVEHPEWLALSGRSVALIGAGAEISPLEPLCAWGADVLAVDIPDAAVWERIHQVAGRGAGRLRAPLAENGTPGVDVLAGLRELRAWLDANLTGSAPVLGMYAYADGGAHVLLAGAFDVLATDLMARERASALAYLATPTDAYVAPREAAEHARAAYRARGVRRVLQEPLKLASGGRLFRPAYPGDVPIADALVKQQGPNYALAKRLQRWRGVISDAAGIQVSFNVAPATWTRSVTKNRVLAAAYAGARHFGVEIFAPQTTRVLMAAMLVHDLHQSRAPMSRPERLFSDGAAHGGLWRAAYEPRSALGLAAVAGLPGTLLRRGQG
jgi:hypothetical protein